MEPQSFHITLIGLILEVIVIRCYVVPRSFNSTFQSYQDDDKSSDTKDSEEEKCYDGLGCVVLTPEWTDVDKRPINVLPNERHIVNTIFVEWKFDQNITYEVLGNSDMRNLPNVEGCCQIILIHDFTSNGYTGWIKHMARAILSQCKEPDINVLSVDWAAGAQPPYVQAVANARLVALEIVHYFTKSKIALKRVHLIGHGLGAHIAGYVGKLVSVNKITGLDPSGPYFKGMPPNVRLHKTDAAHVEIIHTDSTCMGIGDIIGHVDYFPNDGKNQPGCEDSCKKLTSVDRNDVPGKCTNCGDRQQYCHGLQPLRPLRDVNNTNGFFLITANSAPFCGEMLKVLLTLSNKKSQKKGIVKGYFQMTVKQDTDDDVTFLLNENHVISALKADAHYMFIVFRAIPPSLTLPAKAIDLKWLRGKSWSSPPKVASVMITKVTDRSNETAQWFCPISGSSGSVSGIDLFPCQSTTPDDTSMAVLAKSSEKPEILNFFSS